MRTAFDLAMRGRGFVEPNPLVGCVIVKADRIIGQGHHQEFGREHAEASALAACAESPQGAAVYVNLEPCCHTDKKTPPCVPALIQAKVARVVAGCLDPNPLVSGNGLAQLRAGGIETQAGLLEPEARQLNAPFFASALHGRPYVTLKWAQTADGRVAGPDGTRLRISNGASFRVVHQLRSRCDAILIGMGTALSDDPLLTTRDVERARPLLRVVLDPLLGLADESQLLRSARQFPLLVYCSTETYGALPQRLRHLESLGAQVAPIAADSPCCLCLADVLKDLHARRITHLLVEPGPTLADSFIRQNLADRVWVFHSPLRVNSPTAPPAPVLDYPTTGQVDIETDRLTEHLNPSSPVFFALDPSPDLQRICGPGRPR